jgi:hypothetical protein
MKHLLALLCSVTTLAFSQETAAPAAKAISPSKTDTNCYEMRIYHVAPGKMAELEARFKNHVCGFFDQYKLEDLIYLKPLENPESKIVYLLRAPTRDARNASFKDFGADPAWKKVWKETEANGTLVSKIENRFFFATDFSPEIKLPTADQKKRVFEIRTYTTSGKNLAALHGRFRDHTIKLFSKHGMEHFGYWEPELTDAGHDNTLVYFLSHASKDAHAASFNAFRADPLWVAAKEATEKAAGGSLTVPDGVKSELYTVADFSPVAK